MSQSEPVIPASEKRPLSETDRLIGALFDPREAFTDIAARPVRWWVPLVIVTVIGLGYLAAFDNQVGWERFFRQQNESTEQFRNLPMEQQENILQQQLKFGVPVTYGSAVLGLPVVTLIVGGMLLFVFNVLMGQQIAFRRVYAITCYSLLPKAVFHIVAGATMFLKDPGDFDLRNPIASNLGLFFSPAEDPAWLVSLAVSIDAFTLWGVALLAFGFAAAGRRLSWGRAFGWIVGSWCLFLAIQTGIVWIFT